MTDSALKSIAISVGRQREKNESILALLTGAMALLDPNEDINVMRLIEMASDEAGDISYLMNIERAAKAA